MRAPFFICFFWLFFSNIEGSTQSVFGSLDSLYDYVNSRSSVLRSDEIKIDQAKRSRLAAILSIPNVTGGVSLNSTNNTKLPVSLFPAEAFGGKSGTYVEIETGIQYTNSFNQNFQFDIFNLEAWRNLNISGLSKAIAETEGVISNKELFETVADLYYNVVLLNEELDYAQDNVVNADSIYDLVESNFKAGISRDQERDEAEINKLKAAAIVSQIKVSIEDQVLAIKILCDIPESESVLINEEVDFSKILLNPTFDKNSASQKLAEFKTESARQSLEQKRLSYLPVVSVFFSNTSQQFSNDFSLFKSEPNWINSRYVGFRATWNIPSSASISQVSKAKYDYLLSLESLEHERIESNQKISRSRLQFQKAILDLDVNKKTEELRTQIFNRNLMNYKSGIISLEMLLKSQDAMNASHYEYLKSAVNVLLLGEKIELNNEMQ